jgi:hypothetical protein
MGWPIDTNFTAFTDYPGSPSTPGAADMNRLAQGVGNVANPPLMNLSRTQLLFVSSSLTFNRVLWNQVEGHTDNTLLRSNSTGTPGSGTYFTDRIYLPYPGEVWFNVVLRTQTNNSVGYGQLAVSASFDSSYGDSQQDTDTAPNSTAYASVLRCSRTIIVGADQVAAGVALVVDYAQNSGGDNSIRVQYPAYPLFQVRYVGKGGQ